VPGAAVGPGIAGTGVGPGDVVATGVAMGREVAIVLAPAPWLDDATATGLAAGFVGPSPTPGATTGAASNGDRPSQPATARIATATPSGSRRTADLTR
jgi:hypothetical protein